MRNRVIGRQPLVCISSNSVLQWLAEGTNLLGGGARVLEANKPCCRLSAVVLCGQTKRLDSVF
jgi:hypothetical protein